MNENGVTEFCYSNFKGRGRNVVFLETCNPEIGKTKFNLEKEHIYFDDSAVIFDRLPHISRPRKMYIKQNLGTELLYYLESPQYLVW